MSTLEHEPVALTWLREALATFYVHDRELLRLAVGETALTFRLGHHLALLVDTAWDVDAEYDRERDLGALKSRDPSTSEHMRPDLVVHRRGRRGRRHNLLFLEVKRFWDDYSADPEDLEKTYAAIFHHEYQLGVALGLTYTSMSRGSFSPKWSVLRSLPTDGGRIDPSSIELLYDWVPVFDDATLARLEAARVTRELGYDG